MTTACFDRDAMANWYARQHLGTDPGIKRVFYLTKNAPPREIRFVEINDLTAEMLDEGLEAIDFGVDTGAENEHKLLVLDVTPSQWDLIRQDKLSLPKGWSWDDAIEFGNNQQ